MAFYECGSCGRTSSKHRRDLRRFFGWTFRTIDDVNEIATCGDCVRSKPPECPPDPKRDGQHYPFRRNTR